MDKGDYVIHIFIQNGKNFVLNSTDEKQEFDALIQVNLGETKQYSKTVSCPVKSENSRYWGEHFFFEPKNVGSDEIGSQSVEIRVLDKGFFRDSMVGLFDIDVSQIYF